jgi:hypothetical protein
MAQDGGTVDSTNHVTMTSLPRVPEFNASGPEMWFAVIEAYFTKARVTDSQQGYLDIVSSLPPRHANELRDVVMRPLDDQSYTILKGELIKRLSSSQEEKTRQLLANVVMEDEKPSQYLRRLETFAGSAVPEFPQVTRPDWSPDEAQHDTVHHIITTPGPPVAQKQRHLAPDRLFAAKKQFE